VVAVRTVQLPSRTKKKKKGFFSLRVVGAAWRRTLRLFALFSTCFELPF
jgi:hypothetical protein